VKKKRLTPKQKQARRVKYILTEECFSFSCI
jgi:hypothetical protein